MTTQKKFSELSRALFQKDVRIVKKLLASGVDPEAYPGNSQGDSLLMRAVANDAGRELVELLLDHGAKLDAKNKNGVTLAMVAQEHLGTEAVTVLKGRGLAVDERPFSLLSQAEKDERFARAADDWHKENGAERIIEMLKGGADPNTPVHGTPPFLYLVRQGVESVAVYEQLIKSGANLSAEHDGNTALHELATEGTDLSTTELLLGGGVPIDLPNAKGQTALHLAVGGEQEYVAFLLEHGASLSARDAAGQTPVEVATGDMGRWLLTKASTPLG